MNNNFILGAGISGLIYQYYHPEFTIISPEVGGKLNNDSIENIIYLHATPEVETFLKDLNFEITRKTYIIKYVKGNEPQNELTLIDKMSMIKKKLDDKNFDVKDTKLSTNDYYISVFEIDLKELIKKLKQTSNIIDDKVIRITENEIITEKTRYLYKNIISTIPANIFWKLYYKQTTSEFKSKDITFVLCDKEPKILENINYKLCYFIDDKYKYTRVSKRNELFLYEFTGNMSKDEIIKYLPPDTKILNYFVETDSLIYSNEKNIPPKNIQFVGRFAVWEHSYKIKNVIEFAQFNYDFRNIWNRQKMFFDKVDGLSSIQTIEQKEKKTQSFLLHMMSEMAEILENINYKTHKLHKVVDVAKIKEELMDAQKYLISMFLVWGVSVKDFVQEFNRKSDICDDRYEKTKRGEVDR